MEIKYKFKSCIYLFEILLLFALQSSSLFSLEIFGARPLMILPAYISASMFLSNKETLIFSVIAGLFLDMQTSSLIGMHILIMLGLGYIINLLLENTLNISMISAIIISFFATIIIVFVRFLLFYVLMDYGDNLYALLNHYLPSLVYTIIITPIVYLFNRGIHCLTYGKEGV